MGGDGIGEGLLWQHSRAMAAWHIARRPVLDVEIVEQPEQVADGIPLRVGQGARVAMERLGPPAVRSRRARVEAAQLEGRPQDVFDRPEQPRQLYHLLEDLSLGHQVRQPVRSRLLPKFRAGLLALQREELLDPSP